MNIYYQRESPKRKEEGGGGGGAHENSTSMKVQGKCSSCVCDSMSWGFARVQRMHVAQRERRPHSNKGKLYEHFLQGQEL